MLARGMHADVDNRRTRTSNERTNGELSAHRGHRHDELQATNPAIDADDVDRTIQTPSQIGTPTGPHLAMLAPRAPAYKGLAPFSLHPSSPQLVPALPRGSRPVRGAVTHRKPSVGSRHSPTESERPAVVVQMPRMGLTHSCPCSCSRSCLGRCKSCTCS